MLDSSTWAALRENLRARVPRSICFSWACAGLSLMRRIKKRYSIRLNPNKMMMVMIMAMRYTSLDTSMKTHCMKTNAPVTHKMASQSWFSVNRMAEWLPMVILSKCLMKNMKKPRKHKHKMTMWGGNWLTSLHPAKRLYSLQTRI